MFSPGQHHTTLSCGALCRVITYASLISAELSNARQTQQTFEELSQRFAFDGIVNKVGLVKPQRLGDIDLATF